LRELDLGILAEKKVQEAGEETLASQREAFSQQIE
jgi:hypothetical protein